MTFRAVLTVVGQAVGAYVAGPWGAAIGGQIGGALGGAIDGPIRSSQALIDDLGAVKFDYGSAWPRMYGRYRFKVAPMWSSTKRPVDHTTSSGDCLSGETEQTTYTYEQDWMCWAPLNATGFARVWINGELKYSKLSESDADTLAASATSPAWSSITMMSGAADQMPWSVYEAVVGTENAVAYRYRPTLCIEALDLGTSGQPPLVEVEFYTDGTESDPPIDGLLCHFDEMDGSEVLSAVGPNFVLESGASLTTTDAKFDTALSGEALASGVTGTNDTSWRAEGWFNLADAGAGGTLFELGTGSYPYIRLRVSAHSLYIDVVYVDGSHSSLLSADVVIPNATNFHAGVQYSCDPDDAEYHELHWFCDGTRSSTAVTSGSGFGASEFGEVELHASLSDEFRLQFDVPTGDLYRAGYAIPSAPFEPWGTGSIVDPQPADLADIVRAEELLEWSSEAGSLTADDIDVSALVGTEVRGFATTGSPRESVAQLADVYYFGAVCRDKLYHPLRGAASVKTILFDDTGSGVGEATDPFTGLERANDLEIAVQVAVTGPNILSNYEPATETSDRLVGESVELRRYTTPVVFTPAERKGRADTMVLDGRVASHTARVSLDDRHIELEPFDVWTQEDDEGNSYRIRAERETYSDSGREFDVVLDDASILSSVGITTERDQQTINIALPDDTENLLLDTPIFRDADATDPGFYALAKGSSSSVLFSSLDGVSYTSEASFSTEGVWGTCSTTLGDWDGLNHFDEVSTLRVDVGEGTLTSSTRAAMLADSSINLCVVGVDGRWEVARFRDATLVGAGVYDLTGWLRAEQGSEANAVDHTAGETFALINTAIRRVTKDASDIGVSEYYKGVTVRRSIDSTSAERFTDNAVGLKPYAPVDLRKTETGVSWHRRSRVSSRFLATVAPPLGESSESYDVELYSGATLISSDTVTSPEWSVTALTVGDAVAAPIWGMKTISGQRVAIRDDVLASYTTPKSIIALNSDGTVAESSATLGQEISQWTNAGNACYVVSQEYYPFTPYAYLSSKVRKLTRGTLSSIDATNTSSVAGDYVGVAYDGTDVWVSERTSGNLDQLDATTLVEANSYAISGGPGALQHLGGKLWVACQSSSEVVQWDIATQTEDQRFSVVTNPIDLYVNASIVVVYGTGSIGVYDASDGSLITTHALTPAYVQPQRLMCEFGSYLAIAGFSTGTPMVLLIDSTTGLQVDLIASPTSNLYFASGSSGSDLYLTGSSGTGSSAQTKKYTLATVGLSGYTVKVYQNSSVVGRGYVATLEL